MISEAKRQATLLLPCLFVYFFADFFSSCLFFDIYLNMLCNVVGFDMPLDFPIVWCTCRNFKTPAVVGVGAHLGACTEAA